MPARASNLRFEVGQPHQEAAVAGGEHQGAAVLHCTGCPDGAGEAYPIPIELGGARPVRIPLDDAEGHDLDAKAAAVTDRTKVILLCTPNNPTGVPISHGGLEAFLQSVRSDILVVIDEAYAEYAEAGSGPDSLALYRRYPNVCILRAFSKAYGLAGLRVGYAVVAPDIAEGRRRTALPFAVSALAQKAAIASLDAGEEMDARLAAVKQERVKNGTAGTNLARPRRRCELSPRTSRFPR
ncbi:UNVERIFIED_ORG: histidinol-phosphate/aromatic aminotransferase/cobyric acid decarboxylase-like protein [Arthrobacter sp. UYEF2]